MTHHNHTLERRLMNRYILPAMFTSVVIFCLLLMCAAILDGAPAVVLALAVPALLLTRTVAACRASTPPTGQRCRRYTTVLPPPTRETR